MEDIYQNILLPVDGSQESINAFKQGIQQAKLWGSRVFLVHVLPKDDKGLYIEEQNSFLTALENYANKQGIHLHKEIVYGEPRTQIADKLIERWDIDLIIMGATGKSGLAKMLVGSVTSYILRHAKCDVIISR